MKLRGRFYFLAIACVLLVCLDIGVKRYVFSHISSLQGIVVFHDWLGIDFSLENVRNTGAAWGFLSSLQPYLLWGRCAIILALLGVIVFSRSAFGHKAAISFIVTGALGNVLDFFTYGYVVDMFHFCFWGRSFAVFNVADSVIFCGVVALFLQQAREKRGKKRSAENVS